MNITSAEYFIQKLGLSSHPEGGYFKETYRCNNTVANEINNIRNLSTSIYFLLKHGEVSKFHQLTSDEIWYFNFGSSVNIYLLNQDGKIEIVTLGINFEKGERPQIIIPAGTIFGAEVKKKDKDSFSLVSCMVSPGFDFSDFKLFDYNELSIRYPIHAEIIRKLT